MLSTTPTFAEELHTWAVSSGATHALTLTLGYWPERSFDPERSFRPHLKKLFKAYAHEVHGIPRRHLSSMRLDEMPWFAGVYEPATRSGAPYPHIHGCLAIPPGDEPLARGFLRSRWGQDENPALPAYLLTNEPSRRIASRAVVRRPGLQPTFQLTPMIDAGWAGYALKRLDARDRIWTTAEILS